MHRELIHHPHISSYSGFLFFAFVAAWLLARWQAKRTAVEARHIDNLTLIIVTVSLAGARIFSWFFYMPAGISLWRALTMGGGGMVFYGGFLAAVCAVLIYQRLAHVSLAELADICAAPVALGLALGRVGCFLAGCCWGDLCLDREQFSLSSPQLRYQLQTMPALSSKGFLLAATFPTNTGAYNQHRKLGLLPPQSERSLPVHPVQLYEAIAALGLAFWLHLRFRSRKMAGEVFGYLLLGYALIRFMTEFFRADNHPVYGGFTISQVTSLLIGAAGTILLLMLRRKAVLTTH